MKILTWFLLVILLGGGIWIFATHHRAATPHQTDSTAAVQTDGKTLQAIRAQVMGLGDVLQQVSLLSPTAPADMRRVYASFVTRSLLANWEAHPDQALGRMTSSPWPDHIDVIDIEPASGDLSGSSDTIYEVHAMLVQMTSNEVEHGGDAGSSELELVVKNEDNVWKVDSVSVLRENPPNMQRSTTSMPQPE